MDHPLWSCGSRHSRIYNHVKAQTTSSIIKIKLLEPTEYYPSVISQFYCLSFLTYRPTVLLDQPLELLQNQTSN